MDTWFQVTLEADGPLVKSDVESALQARLDSRQCPFSQFHWEGDVLMLRWKRKSTEKKAAFTFVRAHVVKKLQLTGWHVTRSHCPARVPDVD